MYKIIERKEMAPNIFLMEIEAPRVAKSAKPGQFVMVKIDEKGERVPLTIANYDEKKGTVTIVIQAVGSSTTKLFNMQAGEYVADFVGPLGEPSEFVNEDLESLKKKRIMFVAGGVGSAPVYPQVKWLREKNVEVDVIVGGKTKDHLLYIEEMKAVGVNVHICTDDGSAGYKGLVTNLLKELIEKGNKYDVVVAIGPMIMMKFVAKLTAEYGIKTIVSLNMLMVDGTGMCGACRVSVGGETKFTCVDGPEFDGHLVNFDEAMRKQTLYKSEEGKRLIAKEKAEGHTCSCEGGNK